MFELDHLAISATELEAGASWLSEKLGVPLQAGGQHGAMGTHNQLLALGDLYLEVIAIDPNAPSPAYPRWFDLDHFQGGPRLTNWIVRCPDMEQGLAGMPEGTGTPMSLERGDLRWQMAVPEAGILPLDGVGPALITWQGDAHPAPRLTDRAVRLKQLYVSHPDIGQLPDLGDQRVVYETGPAGLRAVFDTPKGEVTI